MDFMESAQANDFSIDAQTRGTGRHKLLDQHGIAAPGERVSSNDIIINKQSPVSTKEAPSEHGSPAMKGMPVSWKAPQGEMCVVDKVLLTQNDDAHIVIKVLLLGLAPCHACHNGREFHCHLTPRRKVGRVSVDDQPAQHLRKVETVRRTY